MHNVVTLPVVTGLLPRCTVLAALQSCTNLWGCLVHACMHNNNILATRYRAAAAAAAVAVALTSACMCCIPQSSQQLHWRVCCVNAQVVVHRGLKGGRKLRE
jgi:hypothetical protein